MDIFHFSLLTCFCHWLRMTTSNKRIWWWWWWDSQKPGFHVLWQRVQCHTVSQVVFTAYIMLLIAVYYRRCGRNLRAKLYTSINSLFADQAYLKTLYRQRSNRETLLRSWGWTGNLFWYVWSDQRLYMSCSRVWYLVDPRWIAHRSRVVKIDAAWRHTIRTRKAHDCNTMTALKLEYYPVADVRIRWNPSSPPNVLPLRADVMKIVDCLEVDRYGHQRWLLQRIIDKQLLINVAYHELHINWV